LPIYHIVGNVSTNPDGKVTNVEAINDVSSVFLYKGIYHVFHQCCQNHWDHVVSKDLAHWTRLPPPIEPNKNPTGVPHPDWYDAHGSWDGSLSVPNDWNGITEPVVIMTTVEGSKPPRRYTPKAFRSNNANRSAGMAVGMAVVRPTNASDKFLLSWTKDAANPIQFSSGALTTPYDTPGQVCKNGDHWNFVILGQRYTTKDETFHNWGVAPGPKFLNYGENGGQWFSKLANLADGSSPPKGSPGNW
jgi:sucrose-6-phosphate hydrolase SacC (GH32 family)